MLLIQLTFDPRYENSLTTSKLYSPIVRFIVFYLATNTKTFTVCMLGVLSAVGYMVMHLGHTNNCSLIYISKLQGSYSFSLVTCHLVLMTLVNFP
jgi:hypothetical protein